VRVTTAFSRLLRLGKGVLVKKVGFKRDTVVVEVALRRRRLVCPECGYSTRARKGHATGELGVAPSRSRGLAD